MLDKMILFVTLILFVVLTITAAFTLNVLCMFVALVMGLVCAIEVGWQVLDKLEDKQ